ncbi:integrase, partial [Xenorhabdus bovienii]|nr:integrase [Xenorhabdus bovienii]
RSEIISLDMKHIIRREQALRVMGKGNKERLSYMPEGTWERLNRWVDEVRGDHPGPLFTRIRRHDDVTDNRLSDQAIYHILEIRRI